eukprot:g112.t1
MKNKKHLLHPETKESQAKCAAYREGMREIFFDTEEEAYESGATVVCDVVPAYWPPAALLAWTLLQDAAGPGYPIMMNMYLTPSLAQGFTPHTDNKDVFIIQLAGCKRWWLRRSKFALPLRHQQVGRPWERPVESVVEGDSSFDSTSTVVLRPGDMLYVPRGTVHWASTAGMAASEATGSLHFTLSATLNEEWSSFMAAFLNQFVEACERVIIERAGDPAGPTSRAALRWARRNLWDTLETEVERPENGWLRAALPPRYADRSDESRRRTLFDGIRYRLRRLTLAVPVASVEDEIAMSAWMNLVNVSVVSAGARHHPHACAMRKESMMKTTFKIPLSFSELEYVNDETIGLEKLTDFSEMTDSKKESVHEFFHRKMCGRNGTRSILDQATFDVAFSATDYARKSKDVDICLRFVGTINRSLSDFLAAFGTSKEGDDLLNGVPRSTVCSAIRANVYFALKLSERIVAFVKRDGKKKGNPALIVKGVGVLQMIAATFSEILRLVGRFWECGIPEESFLTLFLKFSQKVLEEKVIVSNKSLRTSVTHLLAFLGNNFSSSATSVRVAMQQLLMTHEHCCDPLVDVIDVIVNKFEDTQFVAEFLRDSVARDIEGSRDSAGIKNIANFISALSQRAPALMYANTSILLPLLNSGNYNIRNAVIVSLGQLCIACANGTTVLSGNGSARNTFLDLLQERCYDVTAFSRSCCLKVWSTMCREKAIPTERVLVITKLAIDRTMDKSAIVRKNAMRLVQALVSSGPFGHDLNLATCEMRQTTAKDQLRILEIAEAEEAERALNGENLSNDRLEASSSRLAQAKVVEFYDSIVQFIESLHRCVPRICRLLHSESASDVTSALRVVATLHEARLQKADLAARSMLELVWSSKQEYREAVVDTFHSMHVENVPPAVAASRMISAALVASPGTLASLAAVIGALQKERRVPNPLIALLWRVVRSEESATSLAESVFEHRDVAAAPELARVRLVQRGALSVVSMMCAADPSSALRGGRLENMLKILLDNQQSASPDWTTVKYACVILQHAKVSDRSARLASVAVRGLKGLLLYGFGDAADASRSASVLTCDDSWYAAAEQAVNAIMCLCPLPSAKDIAAAEADKTLGPTKFQRPEDVFESVVKHMSKIFTPVVDASSKKCDDVEIWKLAHAVFVAGHVAVKVLVRAENLATLAKALRVARAKAASKARKSGDEDEEDAVARELGLHASSDHKEDEEVATIARDGILGKQLLGVFGPLLVRIVANENGRYGNDGSSATTNLRAAAMISFCKFIAIVALGDLTTRFPNELEPWNKRLYTLLSDENVSVRKNVLMVLTHLVLNDMIKVKGCTHELAKCIEDSDASVRGLARLFFAEFSAKACNNIYNILPDTAGQLSADPDVDAATFRRIAKFLVQYVDKEWHFESLITKMCHRIGSTSSAAHWLDFVFCLSIFPYSERSFKCLSSQFKSYKDALANSRDVYNKFTSGIVSKCKKLSSSKPELEGPISEWIAQIGGLSRNAAAMNEKSDDSEKDHGVTKKVENDENSSMIGNARTLVVGESQKVRVGSPEIVDAPRS